MLLDNSVRQAELGRPGGGGYSYAVPGQSQGVFENIEVIGDKSRSAQSIEWFTSRPDLLQRLSRTTQAQIVMLHVIRNPFDTIARRSLRRGVSLERISRQYFALSTQLKVLFRRFEAEQELGVKSVALHLEDLIRDPAPVLTVLCDSLGIRHMPAYLEACAGIVREKPSLARELVSWSPELIAEIQQEMESFSWMRSYSFEAS